MTTLEPLTWYTWPTYPVPLAALCLRVDGLATRLGVPIQAWQVDGLGPARGFGGRLPSGQVILLEELDLSVRYQGARGPVVYVDAAELATEGPEMLVAELLAALGLSRSDLVSVADKAAQRRAAELSSRVLDAKAARGSQVAMTEPGEAPAGELWSI